MIGTAELIAIVALAATTFISVAAAGYALGGLPRRSEFNELRREVGSLRKEMNDKIDQSHKELSDRIEASHKELSDRIEASHKELSDKIEQSHANLLTEIRRSHQQLLRALINHRHLEPDGEPVFIEPPDAEPVAADN